MVRWVFSGINVSQSPSRQIKLADLLAVNLNLAQLGSLVFLKYKDFPFQCSVIDKYMLLILYELELYRKIKHCSSRKEMFPAQ